jgi:hypothetical protein
LRPERPHSWMSVVGVVGRPKAGLHVRRLRLGLQVLVLHCQLNATPPTRLATPAQAGAGGMQRIL